MSRELVNQVLALSDPDLRWLMALMAGELSFRNDNVAPTVEALRRIAGQLESQFCDTAPPAGVH